MGDPGRRLFFFSHLPDGPARGALVICPSIGAEFRRNYNREVLLARAMAARGIAVLRFQYRGTGASEGDPQELTVDSMIEDARSVAEAAPDGGRIAFLGTRLGATVAAVAASAHPGAPLAVWDPVADPDAYLRELHRSRLARDLRAGRQEGSPEEEIRSRGLMDVLGYAVGKALVASVREAGSPVAGPRPVILVSLGRSNGAHPKHMALAERWREEGALVDLRSVAGYASWWLYDQRELAAEAATGSADLVAPTADWLAARLGEVDR